tara:strand:+ start:120 stop:368 length:249 start_codon:yes stop_codon:yes gene_type:complete
MDSNRIATWQLPTKYCSNKDNLKVSRIYEYRFNFKHYLNDGTRVIPKVMTVSHILDAFDIFGLEVAISSDSYDLYEEDTQTL